MPLGETGPSHPKNPLERNVTLFLYFRTFFNARYYYPIFPLLFFDFGLSPIDFFFLNGVVWTVASIILEVPSGALADQIGRKKLLVAAGVLMVVEMLVLCLTPVPTNGKAGAIVFTLFMINRIFSGAAEAAASGSDEALAYDSLPEDRREALWPNVQARLMAMQAIGMIVALNVGAACYRLDAIAEFLHLNWEISKPLTMKLPLILTLISGLVTLAMALCMKEPPRPPVTSEQPIRESFARTWEAGRWILRNSAPFYILLVLVFFDSIVRLYYTVGASYYRIIGIDPLYYGVIGTGVNLIGLILAPVLGRLISDHTAAFNYRLTAFLILLGLAGMALQMPLWGFLVVIPLGISMRMLHVASSQYLNRVTDSHHRATVLSFRGVAQMLFYGLVNLLAILQVVAMAGPSPEVWNEEMGDRIIEQTSPFWWVWFVAVLLFLFFYRKLRFGKPIDQIIEVPKREG